MVVRRITLGFFGKGFKAAEFKFCDCILKDCSRCCFVLFGSERFCESIANVRSGSFAFWQESLESNDDHRLFGKVDVFFEFYPSKILVVFVTPSERFFAWGSILKDTRHRHVSFALWLKPKR